MRWWSVRFCTRECVAGCRRIAFYALRQPGFDHSPTITVMGSQTLSPGCYSQLLVQSQTFRAIEQYLSTRYKREESRGENTCDLGQWGMLQNHAYTKTSVRQALLANKVAKIIVPLAFIPPSTGLTSAKVGNAISAGICRGQNTPNPVACLY